MIGIEPVRLGDCIGLGVDMFKAICVAAAIAVFGLPASAAVMEAAYEGTVTRGYDLTGLFGPPAGQLDGLGFKMIFVYDTSLGKRTTQSGLDKLELGSTNPTVRATLSINNRTQSIKGDSQSSFRTEDRPTWDSSVWSNSVEDFKYEELGSNLRLVSDNEFYVTAKDYSRMTIPSDLTSAFSIAGRSDIDFRGSFIFETIFFDPFPYGERIVSTWGELNVTSLTVSDDLSPIPLPASFPMIVVALGGLAGLILFRRRAKR